MAILRRAVRAIGSGRLVSLNSGSRDFRFVKGKPANGKATLFSIFKDEIFFCRAFFDHYRSLGVEQFVIIDDGSSDGTLEFLLEQDDCVVLSTSLRFNQMLFTRFGGDKLRLRTGSIALKTIVPHAIAPDDYVLYVDADEFLVMPTPFETIGDLFAHMRANGIANVLAAVVEMFPERFSDVKSFSGRPSGSGDLLAETPFFEGYPVMRLQGDGRYRAIAPTKTFKLIEHHIGVDNLDRNSISAVNAVRHKTPIMLNSFGNHRIDSHTATMPVDDRILLGLMHFVYTRNFLGKLERVAEWRTHSHKNAKYDTLSALAHLIEDKDPSLLTEHSRKYHSAADFEASGIIRSGD